MRSAADSVETVTEERAEARAEMPPVSSLPGLPTLPSLPSLPGLPAVTSLSAFPGEQSVRMLPAPSTPEPGSAVASSSDGRGSVGPAARTASYGPWGAVGKTENGVAAHGGGHRAAPVRHVPPHRAPAGDPNGVLGNARVVDSGSSRHGDAHAVTPYHRVPLRLVPGSAMRTDAAEIQDRYRDIPVFPG